MLQELSYDTYNRKNNRMLKSKGLCQTTNFVKVYSGKGKEEECNFYNIVINNIGL